MLPLGPIHQIEGDGDTLAVAVGGGEPNEIIGLDVTRPSQPAPAWSLSFDGRAIRDFALNDSDLVAVIRRDERRWKKSAVRLKIADGQVRQVAEIDLPHRASVIPDAERDRLVVVSEGPIETGRWTEFAAEVGGPAGRASSIGLVTLPEGMGLDSSQVAVRGDVLYSVGRREELVGLDVASHSPFHDQSSAPPPGDPHAVGLLSAANLPDSCTRRGHSDVYLREGMAFVGADTLCLVDISNPAALQLTQEIVIGEPTFEPIVDLAFADGLMVVALGGRPDAGESRLEVFDATDLTEPVRVGAIPAGGVIGAIEHHRGLLFVADFPRLLALEFVTVGTAR